MLKSVYRETEITNKKLEAEGGGGGGRRRCRRRRSTLIYAHRLQAGFPPGSKRPCTILTVRRAVHKGANRPDWLQASSIRHK